MNILEKIDRKIVESQLGKKIGDSHIFVVCTRNSLLDWLNQGFPDLKFSQGESQNLYVKTFIQLAYKNRLLKWILICTRCFFFFIKIARARAFSRPMGSICAVIPFQTFQTYFERLHALEYYFLADIYNDVIRNHQLFRKVFPWYEEEDIQLHLIFIPIDIDSNNRHISDILESDIEVLWWAGNTHIEYSTELLSGVKKWMHVWGIDSNFIEGQRLLSAILCYAGLPISFCWYRSSLKEQYIKVIWSRYETEVNLDELDWENKSYYQKLLAYATLPKVSPRIITKKSVLSPQVKGSGKVLTWTFDSSFEKNIKKVKFYGLHECEY